MDMSSETLVTVTFVGFRTLIILVVLNVVFPFIVNLRDFSRR